MKCIFIFANIYKSISGKCSRNFVITYKDEEFIYLPFIYIAWGTGHNDNRLLNKYQSNTHAGNISCTTMCKPKKMKCIKKCKVLSFHPSMRCTPHTCAQTLSFTFSLLYPVHYPYIFHNWSMHRQAFNYAYRHGYTLALHTVSMEFKEVIQYSVLACAIVKFSELLLLRNNCFSGRMVSPGHICTWAQKTSDKIIQWVHKMPWACIVFTEGRSQSIVLLATHTIWLSYNIWIVLLHQMEIENVGILLITAC